eukprot:gene15683-biopygen10547
MQEFFQLQNTFRGGKTRPDTMAEPFAIRISDSVFSDPQRPQNANGVSSQEVEHPVPYVTWLGSCEDPKLRRAVAACSRSAPSQHAVAARSHSMQS